MSSWDLTPRPPLCFGEGVFNTESLFLFAATHGSGRHEPLPWVAAKNRSREPLEHPLSETERGTGGEVRLLLLILLALLPLIGHGCHGDDVDHEPTVTPPGYNQR